jgi:hypothetical protein
LEERRRQNRPTSRTSTTSIDPELASVLVDEVDEVERFHQTMKK